MKVEKYILTENDLDIEGITLLSIEEYEKCKYIIPPINDWWWLRSPGYISDNATFVDFDGYAHNFGDSVNHNTYAVRPALFHKSSNFQIGDKVELLDYTWTIISNNMLLCDSIIGHTYFRKNYKADNANNYEESDIKKVLEKWLNQQIRRGIMAERDTIYDRICKTLTDYENDELTTDVENIFYSLLVEIQNKWEDVITANI